MSVEVQMTPSNHIRGLSGVDLTSPRAVSRDASKPDVILLCKPKLHVRREQELRRKTKVRDPNHRKSGDEAAKVNEDDLQSVVSGDTSIDLPPTPSTTRTEPTLRTLVSPAISNAETVRSTPRTRSISQQSRAKTLSKSTTPKPSGIPVRKVQPRHQVNKNEPKNQRRDNKRTSTSNIEDEIDEIAKKSLQLIKKSRIKKEIKLVTASLGNAKIDKSNSEEEKTGKVVTNTSDVNKQKGESDKESDTKVKSSTESGQSENLENQTISQKSQSENEVPADDVDTDNENDSVRPHPPKTPATVKLNAGLGDIAPVVLETLDQENTSKSHINDDETSHSATNESSEEYAKSTSVIETQKPAESDQDTEKKVKEISNLDNKEKTNGNLKTMDHKANRDTSEENKKTSADSNIKDKTDNPPTASRNPNPKPKSHVKSFKVGVKRQRSYVKSATPDPNRTSLKDN